MENNVENAKKSSLLEHEDVVEFIKMREFKEEDFPLIEKLASFPKDLRIRELHNFFSYDGEKGAEQLKRLTDGTDDETKKSLYETTLEICTKYDYLTCNHIVRVLERV